MEEKENANTEIDEHKKKVRIFYTHWQFATVSYEGMVRNFNARVVRCIVCYCLLHLNDELFQECVYHVQNTTLDAVGTVIGAMYGL